MKPTLLILSMFAASALVTLSAHALEVPAGAPVFSSPTTIDNPYHPFVVGRVKTFEILQGNNDATVIDTYLADTRTFTVSGTSVTCRTLEEMELEDGEIVEISRNYFAQADDGTVYYFGETVDNYEDGVIVDHDGSWLVGGPQAGDPVGTATAVDPAVFMPGTPEQGDVFFPEDLFPFVHERDEIIKTGKRVVVPAGQFLDCVKIKETSLLSSGSEVKWYAPGVGVVQVKERGEILELHEIVDP